MRKINHDEKFYALMLGLVFIGGILFGVGLAKMLEQKEVAPAPEVAPTGVLEFEYHASLYDFYEVKNYNFYSNYSCYNMQSGEFIRNEYINGTWYDMGQNLLMDCSNMSQSEMLEVQGCLNDYFSLSPITQDKYAICFTNSVQAEQRTEKNYERYEVIDGKLNNIVCIRDWYDAVLNTTIAHCGVRGE